MRVWIYRPDYKALDNKIDRDYLFSPQGKSYNDVAQNDEERNLELRKLKKLQIKKVSNTKMEVPNV